MLNKYFVENEIKIFMMWFSGDVDLILESLLFVSSKIANYSYTAVFHIHNYKSVMGGNISQRQQVILHQINPRRT